MSVQPEIRFERFYLSPDTDLLFRDDQPVASEPLAVKMIRYLAANHNRVVSKSELLENIWSSVFITDAVVKRVVSQARLALGDDSKNPRFIKTYHARGYQFIAPVTLEIKLPETILNANEFSQQQVVSKHTLEKENSSPSFARSRPFLDFNQFVGRENELATLEAEYRRIFKGEGGLVLITGEPGIGKTQLARNFMQAAENQGAQCLYARFFDYEGSRLAPYEIFLRLLLTASLKVVDPLTGDLTTNYDPANEKELWHQITAHYNVRLPAELFGLKQPAQTFDESSVARANISAQDAFQIVAPLSQCFINISRQQPLVIVLDDLQWADEASLQVVDYLLRVKDDARIFVIGLARNPEETHPNHNFYQWFKRQISLHRSATFQLKPLSEEACGDAINCIFGGSNIAPAIPVKDLRELYQLTGGNPYFLTEVLHVLLTEKVIARDQSAHNNWRWNGFKDLPLPQTLLLAAEVKIESLDPQIFEIVESASVIGDEFQLTILAEVVNLPEIEVENWLEHAVRSGVLSRRGVSSGSDYRFYHTILRRVVYDAIPPRRRKNLHLRIANTIQTVCSLELDRFANAISSHFEVAEDAAQTFEWSLRAWEAASNRWQRREALICIERAQRAWEKLPTNAPDKQLMLSLALGESYFSTGRSREAEQHITKALTLAKQLNDVQTYAAALIYRSRLYSDLSRYAEALASGEELLEIYLSLESNEGICQALLNICTIKISHGDYQAAYRYSKQALELNPKDARSNAIAQGLFGLACLMLGDYAQGMPIYQNAIDYFHQVGELRQLAIRLYSLTFAHINRGFYEEAIRVGREAQKYFRQVDSGRGEVHVKVLIAQARIEQGLCEEAIRELTSALGQVREHNSKHYEAKTLWSLGRAFAELGELAKANEFLADALKLIEQIGDQEDECLILVDTARLRLLENKPEEALALIEKALSLAEVLKQPSDIGIVLAEKSHCHLGLNQISAALQSAERAVESFKSIQSSNCWRAHWALGLALKANGESSGQTNPLQIIAELNRAVELLEEIRAQFDSSDAERRNGFTRARSAPALMLYGVLKSCGRHQEAAKIAESWFLNESDWQNNSSQLSNQELRV